MPTGYTHKLMESGQPFPEFIMSCARAFGALMTMRDDPADAPIPEKFEPSNYSVKALAKAERDLSRLSRLNAKQRLAFGQRAKRKAVATRRKWAEQHRKEDARLEDMERQVKAWTPPSPDHVGLRDFMLDQIKISKNGPDYWGGLVTAEEVKEPMQFFIDALAEAARSIDYHRKEIAQENKRVDDRNRWVKQLRASIPAASR